MQRFVKVIVLLFAMFCSRQSEAGGLTLGWDPPTDGIIAGYILLFGQAPGSYSQQVDVGNTTSYTVNDLSNDTTYYFAVRAYDATGAVSGLSNEVSATVASPSAVTGLALTASLPSPQMVGTSIDWLATVTGGGVAPYEFEWALYQAGNWNVWPWTNASTLTWTPSTPGNDYQVRVAVRSSGSTSKELTKSMPFTVTGVTVASVTLAANVAPPQTVGSTILWSAAASGGLAPYQYRWWVFNGKVWSAATAWTTNSQWSWAPTVANSNYVVRVWARSAGQAIDAAEAAASVPFPIKRQGKCQGPKCN